MLLLTGPPGAASSARILAEAGAALRAGVTDFRLLVPTATLAEHLRHELAREGHLVRPTLIQTLAQFLVPWTEGCGEAPPGALELIVGEVLEGSAPEAFREVAPLGGFRARLARAIAELSDAGWSSRRLEHILEAYAPEAPLGAAFLSVYRAVEAERGRRGWATRAGLLRKAAGRISEGGLGNVRRVFLDGFFSFSEPELELLRALARRADLTIALPRWEGAEPARAALLAAGFAEEEVPPRPRAASTVVVKAAGLEQEAEEIARRILVHAAQGLQFREIGVVLRSFELYAPLLGTVFERFGIPARFYWAAPLAGHAVVRYLSSLVAALQGGWDHAATLAALEMTPSGVGFTRAAAEFSFRVRERLPGKGLASLRALAGDGPVRAWLDRLAELESWRSLCLPPSEWAARLKTLMPLVEPPPVRDGCSHDTAALWRAHAAALAAFPEALEAAAAVAGDEEIPLETFWAAAELTLREMKLRVPDRRRNVVHVMDVFEARQWELPVIFLPGLLEGQFPLYAPPDPFFPDAARRRLREAGAPLETSADLRRRERFLFDSAITRATLELVLSYPESNARGDPNLRSFFLDEFAEPPVQAHPVRPAAPDWPRPSLRPVAITSPDLLARLSARHAELQPTALEDFLQCPYKFFGRHTLKLEEPPPRPQERLDARVLGSIVHAVLAEFTKTGRPIAGIFEDVFARVCARERVPAGCRTELLRLRMREDLERLAADPPQLEGWSVRVEERIKFDLDGDTRISGQIDLYLVSPERAAVVLDFKYSGENRIRKRIHGYEEGRHVQGALYLIGLERERHCRPAGWFYWGLRKEIHTGGWYVPPAGWKRRGMIACTPEELRERLERARQAALEAAQGIRAGRIEARPADADLCKYCACRDVCRIRAAPVAVAAAGGAL